MSDIIFILYFDFNYDKKKKNYYFFQLFNFNF